VLQTIGIISISSISRSTGGLNIGRTYGLRANSGEEGGSVEGACTHFQIIGLHQQAALFCPVVLKVEN
jgi:hypothetical protein